MKNYIFILISFTIISCTINNSSSLNNSSIDSLHSLEKELYSNPSKVLDSISIYNTENFQERDQAYPFLLYAIAHEQKYGVFKDDSLIIQATQAFKEQKDIFNYTRALLYTSIAQFNINKHDSTAYNNLRLVESLFHNNHITDYNLQATLHLYLGRYFGSNSDSQIAMQELNKSLEFGKKANNTNIILNVSLEIFNIKVFDHKFGEAISTISCFGDATEIPPYLNYRLYKSLYNYHWSKKDYKIAIEYLNKCLQIDHKKLKIKTSKPNTYYQLSTLFKKLDMRDSSLYYAQASVNSIVDSTARDSHFYFRYLANNLYDNKQYKKAAELYKTAHLSYIFSFANLIQQRDLEFKTKFNFEEQEKKFNTIKAQKTLILNLLFIFIALFSLCSLSYYFYSRTNRKKTKQLKEELEALKREYNNNWIISEIYKSTSYILPQMINNVSQEAARSRKVSTEMYDSLNRIIDIANSASRASITDITNHSQFNKIFINGCSLDSLTDFEKMVYGLNKVGYSNTEIANFLNSSQSSIRTIKGKISRKLKTNENETETN